MLVGEDRESDPDGITVAGVGPTGVGLPAGGSGIPVVGGDIGATSHQAEFSVVVGGRMAAGTGVCLIPVLDPSDTRDIVVSVLGHRVQAGIELDPGR